MSDITFELAIMDTVLNSMTGKSAPIECAGLVSARGHLIGRMRNCGAKLQDVQPVAWRMCYEDKLLIVNDNVLELDVAKARARVRHLLELSAHPSATKKESLRDAIFELIDKLTAVITGNFPTVTTYQPATS